jgi:hypothetical protein
LISVVTNIGNEGAIELSNALELNSTLASNSGVTVCKFNTGNDIDSKGMIKLAEVLKSNTSLTSLNLSGIAIISFHSHSIQTITLTTKELANYLKHLNQTTLTSISTVTNMRFITFSLNTDNNFGTAGAIKLIDD